MVIYRSISEDEKNDLEVKGEFAAFPGAYEGKLFTDSYKSASTFGRNFFPYDSRPFYIVEVAINEIFSRNLYYDNFDEGLDVGITIAVDRDILKDFNSNMTFTILTHASTE